MGTTGFDFVKAEAETAAAINPIIQARDATVRRVNEGTAQFLVDNPNASFSTEPNEDLEKAIRNFNRKIAAERQRVYGRHTDAVTAAGVEESRRIIEAGRAFLEALDRFERFDADRRQFQAASGVVPSAALVPSNLRLDVDWFVVRVERAAATPATTPARTPGVPLHERVRQLIGI